MHDKCRSSSIEIDICALSTFTSCQCHFPILIFRIFTRIDSVLLCSSRLDFDQYQQSASGIIIIIIIIITAL